MKKKKKLSLIVGLLFFSGMLLASVGGLEAFQPKPAQAVSELTIIWGVPEGEPIFFLENLAPGTISSRTIMVTNNAPVTRHVGIRGRETENVGDLAGAFSFVIRAGSQDIYGGNSPTGPKTLSNFFTESQHRAGIPLTLLNSGQTASYTVIATFQPNSGNEFQATKVKFDLFIGLTARIPDECTMDLDVFRVIYGTAGNDVLQGTPDNDLIFGLEGNDRLTGNGGHDCVVGGGGHNRLHGNDGEDVLEGDDEDDLMYGGNGEDLLLGKGGEDAMYGDAGKDNLQGGEGNDEMVGGTGDDAFLGLEGNDELRGNDGKDRLYGGNGQDTLWGGSKEDYLSGEDGNDVLYGEFNNDNLSGGEGFDKVNGGQGSDTCEGEVKSQCEL